jgi:hypothetical protein
MRKMKTDIDQGHDRVGQMADSLQRINGEMKRLLDKLPLTDRQDVLRISQLVEEQLKLIRQNTGPASPRSMVFLDNARFSAMHLRRRYQEAVQLGRLRGTRKS